MVITLVVTGAIIVGILLFYIIKAKRQPEYGGVKEIMTFDAAADKVLEKLTDIVNMKISIAYNDRLANSLRAKQKSIRSALDEVPFGIPRNIEYLQAVMQSELMVLFPTIEDCKAFIDLDDWEFLMPNHQWEVLLYLAERAAPDRRKYFTWLFEQNKWDREFMYEDPFIGRTIARRIVTLERMQEALRTLYEANGEFTYDDYMQLYARLIYNYKLGAGCLQQLRLTNVDGFNFGTSGSIRYIIEENFDAPYTVANSLWVQVNAGWIHLPFINFESQSEIARIITQFSSWGNLPSLTERDAIKVNDAYDGARITAIRPPVGECWGCFVRKFSASLYSLEVLLNHHGVKNWELVRDDIKWKMRGEQTCGFTGGQNTGKTSLMKAAMSEVRMVNIRVLEMSFELALRELYPWMNVFSVKPTEYISETAAQDVLKKSDAYLSLVGEVATATVASRMIQFCRVASAFTLFSYHSKTDEDYITALATNLFQSGEYDSMDIAKRDVLEVIKHNVHLSFIDGVRRIEFISEIIKLDDIAPYPKLVESKSVEQAIDQLATLQREYYTRVTDRVTFTSRKCIVYDPRTNSYITKDTYTPETIRSIMSKLDDKEKVEFADWYRKNWRIA